MVHLNVIMNSEPGITISTDDSKEEISEKQVNKIDLALIKMFKETYIQKNI